MNTLAKILIFFLITNSTVFGQEAKGQTITVKVENLNSNQGEVYMALYASSASFLNEGFKSAKSSVKNNTCTITFNDIPEGVYAISFYHDENENKKMDTNFLGIPKEDYGCSNNARGFMGPPKWEDAKFEVKNENIIQTITL